MRFLRQLYASWLEFRGCKDWHRLTAIRLGVSRREAKRINYGRLHGVWRPDARGTGERLKNLLNSKAL